MLGLATIAAKTGKFPEFFFKLDLNLTTIFATARYNWRTWNIEDQPVDVAEDMTIRNEFLRAADISRVYARYNRWGAIPADLVEHMACYEEHVRSGVPDLKLQR